MTVDLEPKGADECTITNCRSTAQFEVTFHATRRTYHFCQRHITDRRGVTRWDDSVATIRRIR